MYLTPIAKDDPNCDIRPDMALFAVVSLRETDERAPHIEDWFVTEPYTYGYRKNPDKFNTKNQYVKSLVMVVGTNELSVKEMLCGLGLKDRKSFMDVYLNPAIKGKFVRLLYPNSPRHPRQKYLLTVKGLALYKELTKA